MSAHVLLNLLNELGKSDKRLGLSTISLLFRNEFNKFSNTGACLLDSIYHMTLKILKMHFRYTDESASFFNPLNAVDVVDWINKLPRRDRNLRSLTDDTQPWPRLHTALALNTWTLN